VETPVELASLEQRKHDPFMGMDVVGLQPHCPPVRIKGLGQIQAGGVALQMKLITHPQTPETVVLVE
jgi:hypothetical protein